MRVIPNWLSSTVITQIFGLSPSLKESALQRHERSFPLKNNNLQITFVLQSLERCPLRIQLKHLPNVTNDCLRSWTFLTFLHSSWLCPHRQKSQLICFPVCMGLDALAVPRRGWAMTAAVHSANLWLAVSRWGTIATSPQTAVCWCRVPPWTYLPQSTRHPLPSM